MWMAEGAIHFKEDVLRIKRRRCRSVIPSLLSGQALSASFGSLAGQRSFAALRMTKRDGLLFEMYCPLWLPSSWSYACLRCIVSPHGRRKRPYETNGLPSSFFPSCFLHLTLMRAFIH